MKLNYYILFVILFLVGCLNSQNKETTKASILDITEFVYASVNVVPKNKYYCRPSKAGFIEEIFVEKGANIKKGQPLFSIKATADVNNRLDNASVNLQQAKDNLFGANNKLTSIQNELRRIKEQNIIDSINYQRRKRLWDQNIGSENELEKTLLSYQSSSSRLDALRIEFLQTKSSLKNQFNKAKNLVDTERSLLDDLVISSKIDGKIFTVFKEIGEFISPQENFAIIANTENFIIEMNIDEADISKIEIGDTAIVHLEAFPDTVYTSMLIFISELKDEITQTFKVEGIFTESPSKLFSGLAGEANILIERRKNALVIPSEYIIDGNNVLTENGLSKVRIGVKNFEYVEILDGIDTTTVLLKPDLQ